MLFYMTQYSHVCGTHFTFNIDIVYRTVVQRIAIHSIAHKNESIFVGYHFIFYVLHLIAM